MYKRFFILGMILIVFILGVGALGRNFVSDGAIIAKEAYFYREAKIVEKVNNSNSVFQVKVDLNQGETNCFYVSRDVYAKTAEGDILYILFKGKEGQPLEVVSAFATKEDYQNHLDKYKKDDLPIVLYGKEVLQEYNISN
ncbi:hypothetical protein SAMN02745975_02524 [Geosporobacter subterraneus DSM 17957]|uniref:Uncharacterized protein n=1 Tax=Geosporobacter subterraneus DSM 17957 TaxID=1121919 RepID=A0A1M6KY54_9FIRM|nr:hypothetical protein [Geosporobacter subterraneus]SHJ63839.1 hypothetical protein SAMN02745975_02524 [Geosporobacter subterraneus DSM 17957]